MRILWPTKRGWTVMLGGGAWFLIAMVNHSMYSYLFACAAAGLSIASLISAVLSLHRVELLRATAGDAATGRLVSLPLIIRNRRRRRRQPIVAVERFPFAGKSACLTVIPPLKGREQRLVERKVLAVKRGEFPLDHVLLRSGDPAGLFMRERRFSLPRKMLVLPGVDPISDLHLQQRDAVIATTGSPLSAIGTNQEFYAVREYNPSDGLRYIHWKSSAKYGHLMVREFERNAVTSVAVLLDGQENLVSGSDHNSNLEYLIRVAASISSHVAGMYCQYSFAAGGSRSLVLPPKPASEAEQEVLYQLALMKPGHVPLDALIYQLGEYLSPQTVVFCLSFSASPRLRQALRVLQEQGMTIRWICARPNAFAHPEKRSGKNAPGEGQDCHLPQPAEVHPNLRMEQVFGGGSEMPPGRISHSGGSRFDRLARVS